MPAFLVAPVRGDAVLGVLVHLVGADLHLERLALGADHRRVQRAVVVGLGLGDVVVELARQRRPQVVDDAERRVAILDVVDQDAHGADVVERVDARPACAASCSRCCRCASAGRVTSAVMPAAASSRFSSRDDVLDVALAIEPPLVEQPGDRLVRRRARARAATDPRAPTSAARRRGGWRAARRDRAPRARRARAALGIAGHQVAQRLRALGELDQHDADVLDHRQQHLAQVLGLRRALVGVAASPAARGSRPSARRRRPASRRRRRTSPPTVVGVEGPARRAGRSAAPREPVAGIELQAGEDRRRAERAIEQRLAVAAARIAAARARIVERRGDARRRRG